MPPAVALVTAITTAITSAVTAASAAFTAIGGFSGIVGFLSSPFGALVLGIGLQLISSLFIKRPSGSEPSIEAAKINVRVGEPERWIAAGTQVRIGGGALFGEFDADGNFWYLIVHCDSILGNVKQYYFDNIPIDFFTNNENAVVTNEFCLRNGNTIPPSANVPEGDKRHFYRVYTTTYTENNPIPPVVQEFADKFPGIWTNEHLLVGTTYSLVMVRPIASTDRYKVMRWRGPMGS
jgi:hypothetical protein